MRKKITAKTKRRRQLEIICPKENSVGHGLGIGNSSTGSSPSNVQVQVDNSTHNTVFSGESGPILAIIRDIPPGEDRDWFKGYIDSEQNSRHDFVRREQDKEYKAMILAHWDSICRHICSFICILLFVGLVIVCVMRGQTGWGIAGAIAVIITTVNAFSKAKK